MAKMSLTKEERKRQVVQSLSKLVGQLKDGCMSTEEKPVCFSRHCQRNVFSAEQLHFADDRELMQFALKTLTASEHPSTLICRRECFIVARSNLKSMAPTELAKNVLDNPQDFCCSFGRNLTEDELVETADCRTMARLAIDFKAAQLFFNLIKQSKGVLGC